MAGLPGKQDHYSRYSTSTTQVFWRKTDISDLTLIDQHFGIPEEKTASACELPVLQLRLIEGHLDHFGFVRSSTSGLEELHFD